MSFLSDIFSGLGEIQTDVGSDLDMVVKKHLPSIGVTILIAVVGAILIAKFISKQIG